MGRTDQVLTGGSLSIDHNMKAVLALLLVCLVQISFAEQEDIAADSVSSVANLLLQREVREAAKCEKGDKKCKRQQRQKKKRQRKNLRKQKKDRKNKKKNQTSMKAKKGGKKGKKAGKSGKKNLARQAKGRKN